MALHGAFGYQYNLNNIRLGYGGIGIIPSSQLILRLRLRLWLRWRYIHTDAAIGIDEIRTATIPTIVSLEIPEGIGVGN
jgi:hypothetical protein